MSLQVVREYASRASVAALDAGSQAYTWGMKQWQWISSNAGGWSQTAVDKIQTVFNTHVLPAARTFGQLVMRHRTEVIAFAAGAVLCWVLIRLFTTKKEIAPPQQTAPAAAGAVPGAPLIA